MNKQTIIAGLIALVVVGGLVGGGLLYTKKNHLELTGQVIKVRTHPLDDKSTLAILDFRVANHSTNQFVVKAVDVFLEQKDGKVVESQTVSELDAQRIFTYYPVIGKKYNATLVIRDKVNPGETLDRMVAVRFELPEAEVQNRKVIRAEIQDVDGAKSQILETGR
jgi:hypothetical protein